MFKGIKSKLKKAFKPKKKAPQKRQPEKKQAKKKALKKQAKKQPAKQVQKAPLQKAPEQKRPIFKESIKQEKVASGYFEEVTVKCSGCGKTSKIIKYSGIDMDNYECQKCRGVESEFGDDMS